MRPAKPAWRALALALALGIVWIGAARADALREFRIGYMKGALALVAKSRHALEDRLAPKGIAVKWVEFSVGPPLVEALVAGRIDFGATGNTPPIFAQSAGADLVYVASGGARATGNGILVPKNSPLRTIADLKGKRVGLCKGSAAQNLVIVALEQAGLTYDDIVPVYLSPSDAVAAFIGGRIDAWPTWDPFYALAEHTAGARILLDASSVTPTYAYYLANGAFARAHGDVVREALSALGEVADWSTAHPDEVTEITTAATGLPIEVERKIIGRSHFSIHPVTEDAIAAQQEVADRFFRLNLIPKPIRVRDAIWSPASDAASLTPALATLPASGVPNESR